MRPLLATPDQVGPTHGSARGTIACAGLVHCNSLLDGAVGRPLTTPRIGRIMHRMTGRRAIAGCYLPTRAGRVRRLDFADRSAA
jgi:hypothetical protein